MCIIVDANVRDIVFGKSRTRASEFLLKSIDNRFRRLVIGGKLRRELMQAESFRNWLTQARLAQQIRTVNDNQVASRTNELVQSHVCESDDEHVIALAQESGARLLYSNDRLLQQDFRNPTIINHPRGQVYTTLVRDEVTEVHRDLLGRNDLCAWRDCGK